MDMSSHKQERLDVNTKSSNQSLSNCSFKVVKDPKHISSAHINGMSYQVSAVAVFRGHLILLDLVV